jgi:hypothetical protein
MQQWQNNSPLSAPLHSHEEAKALGLALEDILIRMSVVLEQETNLAKAGKLREAIGLQPEKARLTEVYIKTAERFRANTKFFKAEIPGAVEKMQKLHKTFHAAVNRNMTALATATALSESLINEVIEAVHEHERPAGYTHGGNAAVDKTNKTPPMTLNVSL